MDNHGHCKDYLKNFCDFIDGELQAELCDQLKAHLAECTNCTIILETLKRTINIYQSTADSERLPEDVHSRLLARLKLDDDWIMKGS